MNGSLNELNKKRAKSIATNDFSTPYTKLSHDKLVDEPSSIISFAFNERTKFCIRVSRNVKAFWRKKSKWGVGFSNRFCTLLICFI